MTWLIAVESTKNFKAWKQSTAKISPITGFK